MVKALLSSRLKQRVHPIPSLTAKKFYEFFCAKAKTTGGPLRHRTSLILIRIMCMHRSIARRAAHLCGQVRGCVVPQSRVAKPSYPRPRAATLRRHRVVPCEGALKVYNNTYSRGPPPCCELPPDHGFVHLGARRITAPRGVGGGGGRRQAASELPRVSHF